MEEKEKIARKRKGWEKRKEYMSFRVVHSLSSEGIEPVTLLLGWKRMLENGRKKKKKVKYQIKIEESTRATQTTIPKVIASKRTSIQLETVRKSKERECEKEKQKKKKEERKRKRKEER